MLLTLLTLLLIAIVLTLLWAMQRRLMYFPDRAMLAPRDVGLPDAEQVSFTTADDVALHGWYLRARPPARFTIVVFNGNAGNRAYRAPLAAALRDRGLSVLLFDYRGFGNSAGHPTETGLAADARAARAFLLRDPQVDPAALVYFGESLGAAVALELAVEHPPAALILRSPFASMIAMGEHVYPFLPVRRLLRDRYASIDRIAHLRAPLLVIAGDRDSIVPPDQSRHLFEAASSPKQLAILPGVDHNDQAFLDGREMIDAVDRFLAALP